MEEEFYHAEALLAQIFFPIVDLFVAFFPDMFIQHFVGKLLVFHQIVQLSDYDFFIVGAIEDADFATTGQRAVDAPQIVTIQFFTAGLLKRHNVRALRIQASHDVLDAAVFACSVHRL